MCCRGVLPALQSGVRGEKRKEKRKGRKRQELYKKKQKKLDKLRLN